MKQTERELLSGVQPRFSFELGQSAAEKCDNGIMIKKQKMATTHEERPPGDRLVSGKGI
jgi:hypothetical protein